jgi:hypothetical protein
MSGVVKGVGGFLKGAAGFGLPILGGALGGPLGAQIGGVIGGAISGSGGPRQSTQTGIDPFIDPFRRDYLQRAQMLSSQPFRGFNPASIEKFMNPFRQEVEASTIADFDRQRGLLTRGVNDAATRAHAFGGSRQAVLEAVGQGELNRAEASTLANLRFGGFQDALDRALGETAAARAHPFQSLGFFGNALSGVPQTQSVVTQEQGNPANGALGGLATGTALYDLLFRRNPQVPGARLPASLPMPPLGRPSGGILPAPTTFPSYSRFQTPNLYGF